jgi:hypothetical protein
VAFAAAPRAGDHAERDDVVLVRGREVRITGEAVEIDPNGEGHEDWTRQHWRIQPAAWLLLT